MATSFNVNVDDLQYILKQIKIAEDHAAGKTLLQAIMDAYGVTAANAAQLPAGLRTVDGSLNSLVPGQENFGAADQLFPRLLAPVYTNEADEAPFQGITNTDYSQTGNVVDSDPRTISNLIVDQTAGNPAAVMAALQHSVFSEAILPSQVAAAAAAIAAAYGATLNQPDPVLRAAAEANLTSVLNSYGVEQGPEGGLVIPNLSPDIGLSPGFNAWMTFFGQFFDHGLDLVTKGGNGTVYVPLAADDPLIAGADKVFGTADDLAPHLRFMALTRANPTYDANQNGIIDPGESVAVPGVAPDHQNTTTSFVDQNQTYTSHASHQVFLREYATVGGKTVSTGKLLDGQSANGSLTGAIGNWAEVKANALQFLGIALSDFDVGNVPWLRTDAYGKFIPDPVTGFAQVITGVGADGKINTADDVVVSGTPSSPIDLQAAGAIRTGHGFLNDIAHHAAPGFVDFNHNGVMDGADVLQVADSDTGDVNGDGVTDAADLVADDHNQFTYDDEMLNAHFVTGDGRGNENIALTTVHSIFHSEHNRLVGENKLTIIANGDVAFLNEWLLVDVPATLTAAEVQALDPSTLTWDGERLFQAARFTTEMQYQHLVFEEFARRVQPMVDPFIFNNSPDVDPSILAEFAHTVYRFGHSMLTDTVDRLDNSLNYLNGDTSQETLIAAFLNPQMYIASGATLEEANANIIRGLTLQLGNEIDEFVVPALQSNLLGLPLDLPALNIARGRETGIPSLNETRAQLYNDFGIVDLKPYASWKEFGLAIKNPLSLINFVAAYGTHGTLALATTMAEKRAAAYELVTGIDLNGDGVAADRLAFLNATGSYAGGELGGLNNIDLWVGGLAEKKNEFGGMLGSTFNFIFEYQMENLQNGDRLYYLTRTQGLNLLNNLEPNTFSDMVMRNTALGDKYATHLSGALFVTPDHIIELDRGIAQTDYDDASAGSDPVWEGLDPVTEAILGPKVVRDYTGATTVVDPSTGITHDVGGYVRVQGGEHYVLGGTEGNDTLLSDSGIDTIWGDDGNDYINAGTESDDVFGGEGDDIIEDPFGDDVLRGNQGNDVISEARGADLVFGDEGNDYIILGQDAAEAFGGEGDDFILGGNGKDFILGNEGNDWIEGGGGFETIAGENSQLFFNSSIIGHDVLFGQADETDYDAESGDDIMGSGASVYRYEGMFGFDWAMAKGDFSTTGVDFDFAIPIFTTIPNDILKDRFDQVEAASGWNYDDFLQGDDRGHKGGGSSAPDSVPVELFADHLLTQEGINRINGFDAWFGGFDGTDARQTLFGGASPVPGSAPVSTFRDGNILMGGDGNDLLRGRGGYDLLDGDAYLNVRIKIVHNGVTYSAESLSTDTSAMGQYAGLIFNVDANGNPDFTSPAFGGQSLNSLMLNGTINPGSLSIVREILTDATPNDNVDTAIFQGTFAEYEIEGSIDLNGDGDFNDANEFGAVGAFGNTRARDVDGDGFIYVRDRDTGAVGATIDGVAGSSRGLLTDDRDLLKNIEQLQFADQTITIAGTNNLATGTVTINDATPFNGLVTPYVGQVLTATLSNFADLDGIPVDPATGLPVGLKFEWQTTEFGSNSGWSTIQTSDTYTVRAVDPGHVLRAVAVFKDSFGYTERITSASTDNPTAVFSVNENSPANTVVGLQIPFSVDYDSQSINGQPPVDVDLVTLYHEIDPANSSGGRFKVVLNGVDFNGFPRYSLVVDKGGPGALNYEAPVHTLQNQSYQFVDNQYQVIVNSYSDLPANGGVLVAVRQFTVLLNDVEPELVAIAPVLDLSGPTTGNFADDFSPVGYSGNDGTATWAGAWTETNDNGSPVGGDIDVNNNRLRFGQSTDGNEMITRALDLTGANSASVSFTWQEANRDAGENLLVQAFNGTTWDTIGTILGTVANGTGTFSAVLTPAQIGAHSAIRFAVTGAWSTGESFFIDNVAVNFAKAGVAGNNFATTFTEDGTPVTIAAGPSITDPDSPFMLSATVKLTNARPGDALNTGTLPAGITAVTNTSVPGEITLTLVGIASAAAYQSAIQAVTYVSTSQNPNPVPGASPRVVDVWVYDGQVNSNVATTTINVVAVNDAPVAGDDAIITNIAGGSPIVVPEWALLANDIDPDSTVSITAVSGPVDVSNLSQATNPGSVTLNDTGALGGSFTYTASDGSLVDAANVTVTSLASANVYSENFDDRSYTNNDGAWTDNWVETGDNNSATSGDVMISGTIGAGRLNFNQGTNTNDAVTRAINLAGATSATLAFTWTDVGADAGETIAVEVFNATTSAWDLLGTLSGSATADNVNQAFSASLTAAQMSATSAIRFRDVGGLNAAGENYFIDNLSVTFTRPGVYGGIGNDILVGDAQGTEFAGGAGNDIILANAGNDSIVWNAGQGRDFIDGGADTDTFTINGDAADETFNVYSLAAATAAGLTGLNAATEIVITRTTGGAAPTNASIVAELDNIEEIVINTGPGNDTVTPIGNFNPTSLAFNTIHVNGSTGDNTVDIAGLQSAHRVVLTGDGGADQIIGGVRPQDVVGSDPGASSAATSPTASSVATADTTGGNGSETRNDDGPGAGEPEHRVVEVLLGTDGDDVFHFASVREAAGNIIRSFQPGDIIDLSGIDAVRGAEGNQSFTLVTGEMTAKGQIMVSHETREDEDFTVISGNVHGDDRTDFRISIKGVHELTASDFVL